MNTLSYSSIFKHKKETISSVQIKVFIQKKKKHINLRNIQDNSCLLKPNIGKFKRLCRQKTNSINHEHLPITLCFELNGSTIV